MKLKFKNQQFQQMAVDAVADLFLGQEQQQSTFQIDAGQQQNTLFNEFGDVFWESNAYGNNRGLRHGR